MKLYLISQDVNNDYDTYDSAVVAAESEEEARRIVPGGEYLGLWVIPEHVKVVFIGEAAPGIGSGVVLGSFNAG